jgi:hypothetical protein
MSAETINKLIKHKIECIADRIEITKKAIAQFKKIKNVFVVTQLKRDSIIILYIYLFIKK